MLTVENMFLRPMAAINACLASNMCTYTFIFLESSPCKEQAKSNEFMQNIDCGNGLYLGGKKKQKNKQMR